MLEIECGDDTLDINESDLKKFLRLVKPHAHRWKSFTCPREFFSIIAPYLSSPLPQLEELSVMPPKIPSTSIHRFWNSSMGHASKIFISTIYASLGQTDISRPCERCESITCKTLFTPSIMSGILRCCADLQEIILFCIEEAGGAEDPQPLKRLPDTKLRGLELTDVSRAVVMAILQMLPHKGLNRLYIDPEIEYLEECRTETLEALLRADAFAFLGETKHMSVRLEDDGDSEMCHFDGGQEFDIKLKGLGCWSAVLLDRPDLFPSASLESAPNISLVYVYRNSRGTVDDVTRISALFAALQVTSFNLDCTPAEANTAIFLLLHPKQGGTGDEEWITPRLQKLILGSYWVNELDEGTWSQRVAQIWEMVEARSRAGLPVLSSSQDCGGITNADRAHSVL